MSRSLGTSLLHPNSSFEASNEGLGMKRVELNMQTQQNDKKSKVFSCYNCVTILPLAVYKNAVFLKYSYLAVDQS